MLLKAMPPNQAVSERRLCLHLGVARQRFFLVAGSYVIAGLCRRMRFSVDFEGIRIACPGKRQCSHEEREQ